MSPNPRLRPCLTLLALLAVLPALASPGVGQGGPDIAQMMQFLTGGAPSPALSAPEAPVITGPKPPGMLRIGVVTPKAQLLQGNQVADAGAPVQNALLMLMQGPAVQVVALESRVSVQLAAEAAQKECDFILTSDISQRKRGGTGKKILRGVGRVLSPVVGLAGNFAAPGVGGSMGSMLGAQMLGGMGGVGMAGMGGMGGFGGQVKKQDEFTLTFELSTPNPTKRVLQQTIVARAKRDGEDVLMPLLQKASEAVLTRAVTAKL